MMIMQKTHQICEAGSCVCRVSKNYGVNLYGVQLALYKKDRKCFSSKQVKM